MLQEVDGRTVYVVDLKEIPQLPIVGFTEEERKYQEITDAVRRGAMVEMLDANVPTPLLYLFFGSDLLARDRSVYAIILQKAIEQELITEPGKYALEYRPNQDWFVYKVLEV